LRESPSEHLAFSQALAPPSFGGGLPSIDFPKSSIREKKRRSPEELRKRELKGIAVHSEALMLDTVDSMFGWFSPLLRIMTSFITTPFIAGRYAQSRKLLKESNPELSKTARNIWIALMLYLLQVFNTVVTHALNVANEVILSNPLYYLIDYSIIASIAGVFGATSILAVLGGVLGVMAVSYLAGRFLGPLLSESVAQWLQPKFKWLEQKMATFKDWRKKQAKRFWEFIK
jgi:hypothetical protein